MSYLRNVFVYLFLMTQVLGCKSPQNEAATMRSKMSKDDQRILEAHFLDEFLQDDAEMVKLAKLGLDRGHDSAVRRVAKSIFVRQTPAAPSSPGSPSSPQHGAAHQATGMGTGEGGAGPSQFGSAFPNYSKINAVKSVNGSPAPGNPE